MNDLIEIIARAEERLKAVRLELLALEKIVDTTRLKLKEIGYPLNKDWLQRLCESPIELELGGYLVLECPVDMRVYPQFKWLRWRMDFAIVSEKAIHAFVECDGAAWHSTPEQLANDRNKDKAAEEAGIQMYRFTGSEIMRSASTCAIRVFDKIRGDS